LPPWNRNAACRVGLHMLRNSPSRGRAAAPETPEGWIIGRTTADERGHFVFGGIAPGTDAVIGEKPGFETVTAIVTVAGDARAGPGNEAH